MERNIKIEAITLKKLQIGESNVGITILTSNDEILFVMAFGAAKPKSKLFAGVNPFVLGLWDLYYDPVKEFWRAKEVSIIEYNSDLSLELEAFYTASLFSEIILKSQGSEGVFNLYKESLFHLKEQGKHKVIILQFILRMLDSQGLLPSYSHCSICGKEVKKEPLIFNGTEDLMCLNCSTGPKINILNPGMCIYCSKTPHIEMENAIRIGLESSSIEELKKYLIQVVKIYTGGKLLTLNSANGLI